MDPLQNLIDVDEWFYRLKATFGSRRGSNVPRIRVRAFYSSLQQSVLTINNNRGSTPLVFAARCIAPKWIDSAFV